MDAVRFDRIKQEFMSGEIGYLDAIEALENIGLHSLKAEKTVEDWGQEK